MTGRPRLTTASDLPALAKFLTGIFRLDAASSLANPRVLEWKYLWPRLGQTEARSYVVERDGRIAAHCAYIPVQFRLPGGGTVRSLTPVDWAADGSVPGVGTMLMSKLMKMAETSFVIGGSAVTRGLLPKIGFRQAGESWMCARWLRPWKEFRVRPKGWQSGLRLLHGMAHMVSASSLSSREWKCVPLEKFDASLMPILQARGPATICERTVEDLNILLRYPAAKMKGFLLRQGERAAGYFILATGGWEVQIVDLMADSGHLQDWVSVYAVAIRAVIEEPLACRIRIQATLPLAVNALKQVGFWAQREEPILIYDPRKFLAEAWPINFQLVDGDAY